MWLVVVPGWGAFWDYITAHNGGVDVWVTDEARFLIVPWFGEITETTYSLEIKFHSLVWPRVHSRSTQVRKSEVGRISLTVAARRGSDVFDGRKQSIRVYTGH